MLEAAFVLTLHLLGDSITAHNPPGNYSYAEHLNLPEGWRINNQGQPAANCRWLADNRELDVAPGDIVFLLCRQASEVPWTKLGDNIDAVLEMRARAEAAGGTFIYSTQMPWLGVPYPNDERFYDVLFAALRGETEFIDLLAIGSQRGWNRHAACYTDGIHTTDACARRIAAVLRPYLVNSH